MSVPIITFFNNKGGVGKTSLVYHVAWMLADLGYRVLTADLDPQGNLSAAFLDEDRLEELWPNDREGATIYGAVRPLEAGVGDVVSPSLEFALLPDVTTPPLAEISDRLALIPGDIGLSRFEDELSAVWPDCLEGKERAFRVTSAFWRVVQKGAVTHRADVILMDLGPNLGAINRAALIASDFVVIPLAPDLFSLQGLRNLGPTLIEWRNGWSERIKRNTVKSLPLPKGSMQPVGYIVMQHSVRRDRPVLSYDKWIARIPGTYREFVQNKSLSGREMPSVAKDQNCIALLRHYRSLMPMAQDAGKPIFYLKAADGALGAHINAVKDAYHDFKALTEEIMTRTGIVQAA